MDKIAFVDQVIDRIDPKYIEEPAKKGRKVLRIGLKCAALVLAAFLLLFLCPLPFHKEFKCIRIWLKDPSFQEDITFRFDGFYHLNLFTDDSFSGNLTMVYQITPEYEIQSTLKFSEIVLRKDGTYLYSLTAVDGSLKGFASNDPNASKNGSPETGTEVFCMGRLDSKRFLKGFAFLTSDDMGGGQKEDWEGRVWTWDEVCIVPDCADYESARAYLQEMGIIPQD